jgi:very-short-patch-repair endonuclease
MSKVMKENQQQINYARRLRNEQTDAETILWSKLKHKQLEGVKFRRQQPIDQYIVDFVSFDTKLILEIDGGQHNEKVVRKRDNARTVRLRRSGYCVLRFWDNEVLLNIDGVLEKIRQNIKQEFHPHPDPLPSRERGKGYSLSSREVPSISPSPGGGNLPCSISPSPGGGNLPCSFSPSPGGRELEGGGRK